MMKFITNGADGVRKIPIGVNIDKILYIEKLELLEIDGETPEKSIIVLETGEELSVYGSVQNICNDISVAKALRGVN